MKLCKQTNSLVKSMQYFGVWAWPVSSWGEGKQFSFHQHPTLLMLEQWRARLAALWLLRAVDGKAAAAGLLPGGLSWCYQPSVPTGLWEAARGKENQHPQLRSQGGSSPKLTLAQLQLAACLCCFCSSNAPRNAEVQKLAHTQQLWKAFGKNYLARKIKISIEHLYCSNWLKPGLLL